MVKIHLAAFLLSINCSTAFTSRSLPRMTSYRKPPARSSLSMYIDLETTSSLLSTTFALPAGTMAASTATTLFTDPLVEAEFLNDMAHVALDFTTFFGPATAMLRLAAVIGRVCVIASDYLPDHRMLPEEAVFQVIMLMVASAGFVQSFLPIILASTAKTTVRDGRAFHSVFSQVGMTWLQYKAMAAVALDWVHVEPGATVTSDEHTVQDDDDDYIYWLYRGDVHMHSAGKSIQNVTAGAGCRALLGETRLAHLLEKQPQDAASIESFPKTTLQAGGSGATLLRIHTSKLTMLMDNDKELAEAIRSLLVKGMRAKLGALMAQAA